MYEVLMVINDATIRLSCDEKTINRAPVSRPVNIDDGRRGTLFIQSVLAVYVVPGYIPGTRMFPAIPVD